MNAKKQLLRWYPAASGFLISSSKKRVLIDIKKLESEFYILG